MISKKISDTRKLARDLARSRIKSGMTGVRVYALVGDLGSGKTTFTQAFLRVLGARGRITSPTFVLIKNYETARKHENKKTRKQLFHIDAYRINKASELVELGFKEILNDKNNIILIEWADKVKKLIPKSAQWIYFEHGTKSNERIIKIK
ncbi:MAG: tRNA (adenosine(37)-N6)-threonylcarbamoyltransferase complex ATPase subunit type 1 TsaE [Patescibacteria group bacterium]